MGKMMKEEIRFLETITFFGNDVLVPINRIKYVHKTATDKGYEVKIVSDDGDWSEGFDRESECNIRYEQIKIVLKGK